MESETSNLLLRTTWNSFVYCMLCSIWLLPMGDSISRKYYHPKVEVFLDYNLYPKMNCDILIFSDLKNVLFALEMCLSLIPEYLLLLLIWNGCELWGKFWYMFDVSTDIISHSCPNHNWFSKEFQIISAAPILSDKHCYLVEFFPTLYNE